MTMLIDIGTVLVVKDGAKGPQAKFWVVATDYKAMTGGEVMRMNIWRSTCKVCGVEFDEPYVQRFPISKGSAGFLRTCKADRAKTGFAAQGSAPPTSQPSASNNAIPPSAGAPKGPVILPDGIDMSSLIYQPPQALGKPTVEDESEFERRMRDAEAWAAWCAASSIGTGLCTLEEFAEKVRFMCGRADTPTNLLARTMLCGNEMGRGMAELRDSVTMMGGRGCFIVRETGSTLTFSLGVQPAIVSPPEVGALLAVLDLEQPIPWQTLFAGELG